MQGGQSLQFGNGSARACGRRRAARAQGSVNAGYGKRRT